MATGTGGSRGSTLNYDYEQEDSNRAHAHDTSLGAPNGGALRLALALALAGAGGPVGKGLDDAIVGGVLGEILEPQQSGALALKDEGDPAEGVVEVPDGDTDAATDLDASADNL